jgi:hypothetical protein
MWQDPKDGTNYQADFVSSLAYSEMRLILALIVFNFDMKLDDDAQDWIQQKNFLMWQKGPLKVHLTPVGRSSA